jgi:hypothetical protein
MWTRGVFLSLTQEKDNSVLNESIAINCTIPISYRTGKYWWLCLGIFKDAVWTPELVHPGNVQNPARKIGREA